MREKMKSGRLPLAKQVSRSGVKQTPARQESEKPNVPWVTH